MGYSLFGEKFTTHSGITMLMDDLNIGCQDPNSIMLGGGNPAKIPQVNQYFDQLLQKKIADKSLLDTLTNYDGPQGKDSFINALVTLFNDEFHWGISNKNIVLTNGSQNAFFSLFNLFAGHFSDGTKKKILLPLSPEYIGYADACLEPDSFISYKPEITELEHGLFKYHIDFDALEINHNIGAICVSRPTNPTGNVLTDNEIKQLSLLAKKENIPLIIDNAYGLPFPNIIFEDVRLFWEENIILSMSLSKLGLPGARCGIIVANEEHVKAISNINGICNLTPVGIGGSLVTDMIEDKTLLPLSKNIIKPYYQHKAQFAVDLLQKYIPSDKFKIHKPEGAIFLWLWFKELPISGKELYQRLKNRGVFIIPGEYFFIGLQDAQNWKHASECLRMNYIAPEKDLENGIKIIAEEVNKAYLD